MKNKETKYVTLSHRRAKEIEKVIFTIGEEFRGIDFNGSGYFALYRCNDQSVAIDNKPLYAMYATADFFRAFGFKDKYNGLVTCGYELDSIVTEMEELAASYLDRIKEKEKEKERRLTLLVG